MNEAEDMDEHADGAAGDGLDGLTLEYPDITDDLIVILDRDEKVLWKNAAMTRRSQSQPGVPEDQVLDWMLSQVKQLDVGVHTRRNEWMRWRRRENERVITLNGSGGRSEHYRFSSKPVRRGDHTYRVISLHDVSVIKQRESELREHNTKLEHRLNHDRLTGLPNVSQLFNRLKRALRLQDIDAGVGVMVVELQRFRELNNIYGPAAADQVMMALCQKIRESLEDDQFVARSGRREFAVLFEEIQSFDDLLDVAEKLEEKLRFTIALEAGQYEVTVNIAVVEAELEETNPERLLMDANIALYHPEIPSLERVRPYHPEMRGIIETRTEIYAELNEAVKNDQIEPFFQPQVRLTDGSLLGFEVLVRWRHPDRGLIPPGVFIGVAEDTGLLPAIDDTVMRKAFETVANWRKAGYRDLRVSLNASSFALRDPTYPDRLMWELDRYDLSPATVAIEILETVLIDDDDDVALEVMRVLKANGIHLELDDFGTGSASIAKVVQLGVDTVKLDHSIVRGIEKDDQSRIVVETALMLAQRLQIESLAEGIEEPAQLEILRQLGCDYGQGYGIGRPMSAEATVDWMVEDLKNNIAAVHPGKVAKAG